MILKIKRTKFFEFDIEISRQNYFTRGRKSAQKKAEKHTIFALIVFVLQAQKSNSCWKHIFRKDSLNEKLDIFELHLMFQSNNNLQNSS